MNIPEPRLRAEPLSAFVVLALLVLLLMPFWIQHSVQTLRAEIDESADPARAAVTEIQYLLARQTSSLRGFLITGDSSFLEQFERFAERERSVHDAIESLIAPLGSAVQGSFAELATLSREWHERLEREGEIATPPTGLPLRAEVPFEHVLYHDALSSAGRLDEALAAAARARHQEIRGAEMRGAVLSAVLGILAVAAALAAANLGVRIRRLAHEAELRRREAVAAAEARTRAQDARSRLLRGVGHDVKNPLGAADGYAELLEMGVKGDLLPAQRDYVTRIRRSIHAALEVIHDLVELSRAETEVLVMERELVDLTELVGQVVDEYEGAARRAGLSLTSRIDPCPPLYTDAQRVRRIIGNLLSNAIKYTPEPGLVEVRTALETTPDGAMVVVEVADSGPGIPPEKAEAVFDEFVRLETAGAPGHGLGLAISRRYARLLGGDLTVGRAAAGGAAFSLRLPVRAADAAVEDAALVHPAWRGEGTSWYSGEDSGSTQVRLP